VLFNKLEPLVHSPTSIATTSFADVTSIVGTDPFSKSEEDTISDYNSSVYVPQIVFLGLDERSEGLVYKEHYKGVPWFAVDVTPKGGVMEECEKLIKKVTEDGKEFSKGRMHLSLPAQEGPWIVCDMNNVD
jgi:NAD+ diphosphatase